MDSQPDLSIVFPAYNEAANIEASILDAIQVLNSLGLNGEIVVVNDGSHDQTASVVRDVATRHQQVHLINHEMNQGYGAAVWTGLTNATGKLVFFCDADRQFDLAELEKLVARRHHAPLVVGYRAPRRDPVLRRLNGWGWSHLVTLLFGYTARDIDCAFKMLDQRVIDTLRQQVQSRGATFSAELLVRAKRAGFQIAEVAIVGHRPRVAGNPTGAKLSVIIRAFRELLQLYRVLNRERRTTKPATL